MVSAPTFNPSPGTYPSAQNVTITTATTGATIRYTTDGSPPSETLGTVYAGPVAVSSSMTIKAVAYMSGWTSSSVSSGTYTITGSSASLVISAGITHNVAIRDDGSFWAWGSNSYGELGDGTSAGRRIPGQTALSFTPVSASAANHYVLAVKNDNTVWGWGFNGFGQLGNGNKVDINSPVQATGLADVAAVSAG
jgi:hypothetical protein